MKDSNKNRKLIRSVSAFAFALTFLASQSSTTVSASDIDFFLSDSGANASGQTNIKPNKKLFSFSKADKKHPKASKAEVSQPKAPEIQSNNEEELPDWLYNWIKSENSSSDNKTNVSDIESTSTIVAVPTMTALAAFSVMTANLAALNTPLSVISAMTTTLSTQEKQ